MPTISVIMNCMNGEPLVRQAIESVYAQTFTDWEIIFWDNVSTDTTQQIAQSFDARLRYFRGERRVPLGTARKFAIAEARGQWLAFTDHDDVNLPFRFERQMKAIGNCDYSLCYGGIREIDAVSGAVIRDVLPSYATGNQFGKQLIQFEANLQTTMLNLEYMKRYAIEIAESFVMFEDYNLFMKLAAKGPVAVVPEILPPENTVPITLLPLLITSPPSPISIP